MEQVKVGEKVVVKKPPKEKEPVDPAVKLLKDANAKLAASLRTLKTDRRCEARLE